MNWRYLTRNEIIMAIVVAGVFLFFLLASVLYPVQVRDTNYGFGPEWSCLRLPKGPICIRRP